MLFGIVYKESLTNFANRSPLRLLSSGKLQTGKKSFGEGKEANKTKSCFFGDQCS